MADIEYTQDVYGDGAYADDNAAYDAPYDDNAPYDEDAAYDTRPAAGGGSIGKAVNVLGAVASLVLVVGVGVWGYRLLVRDVSGVPVVRALEGPMRVQPDDPGGQPADHQGLAVNRIAAQGTAAPPADRLVLAPRPVTLTDEDAPMAVFAAAVAQAPKTAAGESGAAASASQDGAIDALIKELTAGGETPTGTGAGADVADERSASAGPIVQPEPLTLAGPEPETEPGQVALVQPAVLKGPGLARSLRPMARPARAVADGADDADVAAAIKAAVDTSADLDVDADSLPAGTRLAQLGAYDSPEIARAEWDRLNARFEDYLEGKKRVIQQASSGGRTFYRLRAMGFDDLSDARRFCSALVAENADCIPVTTR